jgi:hypothetical protein
LSEEENEEYVKPILLSTSVIIFLGCPHRSSEHARLGDAIRSMASMTLGVDSRDPVLWDLSGSASLELELGRQAFIRMWNDYNFKVKTYQESMVSAARFLEIRAEAAVRRQSSFIGNPREAAETIAASHLDICKFSSAEDSGYRSLANCLARYICTEANHRHNITDRELECLAALTHGQFPLYETHSPATYPGTCLWLYDLPEFQAWHHRSDQYKNKVLWIKGQSGSGKSVLLRSLRSRIERQWAPAGGSFIWTMAGGRDTNAIFFPGSCRQHAETDPSVVYRSLLAQLFLQDPHLRKTLLALYEKHRDVSSRALDDASVVSFFVDDYIGQRIETPARRTFIFVDVSDNCGPSYLRDLLAHLSQLARNSDFSICVASGNPLGIVEPNAIDVVMQHRNADDILRYVNVNLVAEWEERNRAVVRIGQKAAGVFLWAEIVVNILNAAIGEGASPDQIEYTLEEMPGDLHGLYEWMLNTLNDREKAEALVLFQWVVLAAEPLRLNDLLVAVRLTRTWPMDEFRPYMALEQDPPSSIRELRKIRNSEVTTDNPYQFNRWIRARSIGLLELRSESHHAGGVVTEPWGMQRVQVAHDSVKTFFLSGAGFACLTPSSHTHPPPSTADLVDKAHYALLHACLTYLNMRDLAPLSSSPHHTTPVSPLESPNWARSVHDQRALVTSSFPFLSYAVRNLLFHMLCPPYFRYFLPQAQLLRTLSANKCRLWRRWTALLGCAATAEGVLGAHAGAAAGPLLAPVFGGRFRLERVFRRLSRMVAAGDGGKEAGVGVLSPGLGFPLPPSGLGQGTVGSSGSAVSEKTVWGSGGRSFRSEASARSLRSEKKGRMPPVSLSPRWKQGGGEQLGGEKGSEQGTWPLVSPGSGYSSHYSGSYVSKRSPLTVNTFQALDGLGDGVGDGLGVSRVDVGVGMARSAREGVY